MKKYLDVLKKCSLFEGVEEESIIPMLGCLDGKAKSFEKRETVSAEGVEAKFVGIVLSGKVQIEKCDIDGNRSIVGTAEASEMFGETFACAGVKKLPVNVVTVEKSEIFLADCKRIICSCSNACEFHNKMIYNLLKTVAEKNIRFNKKLEILSKRTTKEKLMAYLKMLAKEKGTKSFEIPFDRKDLADYLQVDRSGLSSEMSKLADKGIIAYRKNFFELL